MIGEVRSDAVIKENEFETFTDLKEKIRKMCDGTIYLIVLWSYTIPIYIYIYIYSPPIGKEIGDPDGETASNEDDKAEKLSEYTRCV